MKKLIPLLSFLFLGLNAHGQHIISISKLDKHLKRLNLKTGDSIYFKDTKGLLDQFTGTWEGKLDHKFYSIKIEKKLNTTSRLMDFIIEDKLIVQFEIKDEETKQTRYNKQKLPEALQISLPIYSMFSKTKYVLQYYGNTKEKVSCGDKGYMFLELIKSGELKVHVQTRTGYCNLTTNVGPSCPEGKFLPPFPDEAEIPLLLKKQEIHSFSPN